MERSAIVWPRAADLYLYQPGIAMSRLFFTVYHLHPPDTPPTRAHYSPRLAAPTHVYAKRVIIHARRIHHFLSCPM